MLLTFSRGADLVPAPRCCPVCDSPDTQVVGPILHPRPAMVAGVPLDLGTNEFWLRRCGVCEFQFKDPSIEAAKLIECYAAANSDHWGEAPDPWQRKFDVLRDVLERHARGPRVLDVGCFNGAMLDYFGERWQRFGIEPCLSAAELARSRNVRVLADTLEHLDAGEPQFDAVFAIDVLEHLVEPVKFVRTVSNFLAPGGVFIVLTGNTNALAWRLQRGMYWYCSLPEHISFYNRAAMARIGELTGLRIVEFGELCHKRLPLRRWTRDIVKSSVYVAGRAVGGLGMPSLRRVVVDRRGPSIQTAKDHLLCVLRKS